MNTKDNSIKTTARIGGLLYLIIILGGIFAELMVRGRLFVSGDAVATSHNILTHELLYRWGFAVEVFYCACNIPLIFIFYRLFNVVSKKLSWLVVVFSIVGTAIEAVSLLLHFAPLILLNTSQHLGSFTTAQLQDMAYTSLRFFEFGFCIALVFFSFYCVAMGYMIFRSGFLPRIIGVLLAFQGFCYFINSFANFLAPKLASQIFPLLALSGLGEISFCLWLLIKGVNETNWKAKANTNSMKLTT